MTFFDMTKKWRCKKEKKGKKCQLTAAAAAAAVVSGSIVTVTVLVTVKWKVESRDCNNNFQLSGGHRQCYSSSITTTTVNELNCERAQLVTALLNEVVIKCCCCWCWWCCHKTMRGAHYLERSLFCHRWLTSSFLPLSRSLAALVFHLSTTNTAEQELS